MRPRLSDRQLLVLRAAASVERIERSNSIPYGVWQSLVHPHLCLLDNRDGTYTISDDGRRAIRSIRLVAAAKRAG